MDGNLENDFLKSAFERDMKLFNYENIKMFTYYQFHQKFV
jgi:hypothetical protein